MSKRRRGPAWKRMRFDDGTDVIVHYDDVPETDITTHNGIRVTTPVRTVIDIAPDLKDDELRDVIESAIERGLLTVDELLKRASQRDVLDRPGIARLRHMPANM